ncbi:MAG: hypothetical protein J6P58_09865, partial [Oscillospiraceae bacterium]|nr:hypothetical protein [Oscillospiraceae bacterium]
MERRRGKLNIAAALLLCLAAGFAALAVGLFFRAGSMPVSVSDGPESPGAVLESFFDRLSEQDAAGAAALTAEGDLPLPEPADGRSALLWAAQRQCWRFEIVPGYEEAGAALGKRVTVTAPDLSLAREHILALVQAKLEQALDAAHLKSDVYDPDG